MDPDSSLPRKPLIPKQPGKLAQYWQIFGQMGPRYFAFRVGWELMRKSGFLKKQFPINPPRKDFISLETWRKEAKPFFFQSKEDLEKGNHLPKNKGAKFNEKLDAQAERILEGQIQLFSSQWENLGSHWDWHTHPETEYKYPADAHWLDIADYSSKAGDIKYVWEKARFSFLYPLIRHDWHSGQDHSEAVFAQIEDFIDKNPINQGPQYRCSQEISLRVLNWAFALYYYLNSPNLTEALFGKMMHSIRWQLRHVRSAIHFSRIAVRNNHAITETLALYLGGLLYPHFPESSEWKKQGKAWFEEEVAYQVYPDGTYLQFSMNYHRVVVQLLTWALVLAEKNGESFAPVVQQRAEASLAFLLACQDAQSGWLPNYGANDGALFFPLSTSHYRDYRPQLNALALALGQPSPYPVGAWQEDAQWMGITMGLGLKTIHQAEGKGEGTSLFKEGGYSILKDKSLTFMRCGSHRDRPSQADNLHLDLWHNGRNLLVDAGSYKYNTDRATLMEFVGTAAHNTVTLGRHDQMRKGPRFVWFNWSQAKALKEYEEGDLRVIQGQIRAFGHVVAGGAVHTRTLRKHKTEPYWEVIDEIDKPAGMAMLQHWHPLEGYAGKLVFEARDATGNLLTPLDEEEEDGWYSSFYGRRMPMPHLIFSTRTNRITTTIRLVNPNLPVPLYPDMPLDES